MTEQPKKSVISWIRSIPYILVFVSLLICFDLVLRIARLFGKKVFQKVTCVLNLSHLYALRIAGVKFQYAEFPKTDLSKPLVIVSNHQSLMDIPIIYRAFIQRAPRFISKKELAKFIPFVSLELVFLGGRTGKKTIIDNFKTSKLAGIDGIT